MNSANLKNVNKLSLKLAIWLLFIILHLSGECWVCCCVLLTLMHPRLPYVRKHPNGVNMPPSVSQLVDH